MKKLFELINKNITSLFVHNISNFINNKKSDINLPVITISREKGSGGRIVAHQVAKNLGGKWRVYNQEIIEEIAKSTQLTKELIKEIDEKKLSLTEVIIHDLLGKRYISLTEYQKLLVKTITNIAHRGYAIIVGRGAEYIIPYALKIRIICEMEERINNMIKFEQMTRKQAIQVINKSDKERSEFIKSLYHHDVRKPHHYDLVIRISKDLSVDDATSLIILAAKRRFKL
jgi:cytidylate kinase